MNFDHATSSTPKERVLVIGAGPMGLAAAYYACKAGYDVELIEANDRVGGMAAHFDFDGLSIERFYHFCCLSDSATLDMMSELGMSDDMKWVTTTMGYQVDGKLHDWGNPIALLKFPGMNFVQKVRYGLQAFYSTKRSDWKKLDRISAEDWFVGWCGKRTYEKMWKPLLEYKFYKYTSQVSAAWMWQRIKRIGNSRKSLFEERLGYIDGGSERLMIAMAEQIKSMGGQIHLSTPATKFVIKDGAVSGVKLQDGRKLQATKVISTMPLPVVAKLLSDQPDEIVAPYLAIENVGCVCVILKLKRRVTKHFWVNITGSDHEIPGIVEFSNLRPIDNTIVYVPFYMPNNNPKFARNDEFFIAESLACLKSINSDLDEEDVLAVHVGRLQNAQPVCDIGFSDKIPDPQSPIKGLQIADTCFYYPEDRGVSESIQFARQMVDHLAAHK